MAGSAGRQPSKRLWINTVTQEALAAGKSPVEVMAGTIRRGVTQVRWRAWCRLMSANEGYSMKGIANVSGFDHTSIRFGVARLAGLSRSESKRSGIDMKAVLSQARIRMGGSV
jgi:hypothetical protein